MNLKGYPMKKLAAVTLAASTALMLVACGQSDSAKDGAQADNVEMPAEEAVGDIEATPVADASSVPGAETATAKPVASEPTAAAKPSGQ